MAKLLYGIAGNLRWTVKFKITINNNTQYRSNDKVLSQNKTHRCNFLNLDTINNTRYTAIAQQPS